jgi:hypothetical protein
MRKMALLTLAFAIAVLVVMGIRAQQGHITEKQEESFKASRERLDKQLPIVDYNEAKPTQAAERARRVAKDRRHNRRKHEITEGMTETSTNYHWPADFPPLPVEQSTTVVIGKVSAAKAHISENRSAVYSEVVVEVQKVLKDNAGVGSTVVAERDGGRIRFPSGSVFRYFINGLGIPEVGHTYLLFLKQLEDSDFSIITGYELREGRVTPLDESGVVPFEKYKDWDEAVFVNEVLEHSRLSKAAPLNSKVNT